MEKIKKFFEKDKKKKAKYCKIFAVICAIINCILNNLIFNFKFFAIIASMFLFLGIILNLHEKYLTNFDEKSIKKVKYKMIGLMFIAVLLNFFGAAFGQILAGIMSPFFYLIKIMGSYLFLGAVVFNLYLVFKHKGAKIEYWIYFCLIAVTLFSMYLGVDSLSLALPPDDSNGCSICGDPIFSGKFCKKHFNSWANWQSGK